MSSQKSVGIVSLGMYLPDTIMTSAEIAEQSGLPEWVVREKLGIHQKHISDPKIHPNQMAVYAAKNCLSKCDIDPKEIDVILCTTEEWREYLLWTSGIDIAYEIGAVNAWGMDIHMRCATTIAAMKTAKSLMAGNDDINTVMIAGGYRISDFIDLKNIRTSFIFNIGAGAGAMILKKGHPENHVLGSHLISDGYMSKHVVVPASGTIQHPTDEKVKNRDFFFDLVEPELMKDRLNDVTMDNWMECVDQALAKSSQDSKPELTRENLDFLNLVLIKPSAHKDMLKQLELTEEQSVYLNNVGHIGEQDSILNMIYGEKEGKLKDGDLMAVVGAGIGYVWGAACVRWGACA